MDGLVLVPASLKLAIAISAVVIIDPNRNCGVETLDVPLPGLLKMRLHHDVAVECGALASCQRSINKDM